MKSWRFANNILLVIMAAVILLFLVAIAFAENEICVSGQSGIKIAQELERAEKLKELISLQEQAITSLETRVKLQTEIMENDERMLKLKDDQISAQSKAINNFQQIVDLQTDAIKKMRDASQPSVWEQMKNISVGAVIGAIIIGVLVAF